MKKKLLAAMLCFCMILAAMAGCDPAAPQALPDDLSDGEETSLPEEGQPPAESEEPSQPEPPRQEDDSQPQQDTRKKHSNSLVKDNPPAVTDEASPASSAASQPAAGQTTTAAQPQPTTAVPEKVESEAEDEELPAATAQTGGSGGKAVNVNDYSSSYKGSVYYQRLKEVALTGNYRTDILAVARSQLGYKESDSSTQLDGSKSGNGNYTEYGRFCGTNGTAWCSEFASWCARQAGIPTSVLGTSTSARAERFGGTYHPWSDTVYAGGRFQPRPGDLVFFAWSEAARTAAAKDHTGIFVSADWTAESLVIYTLDGNSSDRVQNNTRKVTNQSTGRISQGWIAGFIAPNYGDGDGMVQGKVTPPAAESTPSAPSTTTPSTPSTSTEETPKVTVEQPAAPSVGEEEEQQPSQPSVGEDEPPVADDDDTAVAGGDDAPAEGGENEPVETPSGENGDEPPGEDAAENMEE